MDTDGLSLAGWGLPDSPPLDDISQATSDGHSRESRLTREGGLKLPREGATEKEDNTELVVERTFLIDCTSRSAQSDGTLSYLTAA